MKINAEEGRAICQPKAGAPNLGLLRIISNKASESTQVVGAGGGRAPFSRARAGVSFKTLICIR